MDEVLVLAPALRHAGDYTCYYCLSFLSNFLKCQTILTGVVWLPLLTSFTAGPHYHAPLSCISCVGLKWRKKNVFQGVCGKEKLFGRTFTGLNTSVWCHRCWLILTNTPCRNLQVTSAACSTELCLSQTGRSSTVPSSPWTVSTNSFKRGSLEASNVFLLTDTRREHVINVRHSFTRVSFVPSSQRNTKLQQFYWRSCWGWSVLLKRC